MNIFLKTFWLDFIVILILDHYILPGPSERVLLVFVCFVIVYNLNMFSSQTASSSVWIRNDPSLRFSDLIPKPSYPLCFRVTVQSHAAVRLHAGRIQ